MVGVEVVEFLGQPDGVVHALQVRQDVALVGPGQSKARVKVNGPVVLRQGGLGVVGGPQGHAEIIVYQGVLRAQGDGRKGTHALMLALEAISNVKR